MLKKVEQGPHKSMGCISGQQPAKALLVDLLRNSEFWSNKSVDCISLELTEAVIKTS